MYTLFVHPQSLHLQLYIYSSSLNLKAFTAVMFLSNRIVYSNYCFRDLMYTYVHLIFKHCTRYILAARWQCDKAAPPRPIATRGTAIMTIDQNEVLQTNFFPHSKKNSYGREWWHLCNYIFFSMQQCSSCSMYSSLVKVKGEDEMCTGNMRWGWGNSRQFELF